mgnify:CR=1 FL=1
MREPTKFEYKDHTYQINRMDAIGQAMLAQKLTPLVTPVLNILAQRQLRGDTSFRSSSLEMIVAFLQDFDTLSLVLEKVPAETMREIYEVCMSRLMREAGKDRGWQKLWANGQFMYDDIEGFDVIYLSFRVIQDQLGNFIKEALSAFGLTLRL